MRSVGGTTNLSDISAINRFSMINAEQQIQTILVISHHRLIPSLSAIFLPESVFMFFGLQDYMTTLLRKIILLSAIFDHNNRELIRIN